jgi:hypothetical protein
MKEKSYTLLAEVNITFTKTNPWNKKELLAAILKGVVEKVFIEAVKVEVSIPEMQHGLIDREKKTVKE